MAIPGPASFVRVAIITGVPQHGRDFRGRISAAEEIMTRGHNRIGAAKIRELQKRKPHQQHHKNPF